LLFCLVLLATLTARAQEAPPTSQPAGGFGANFRGDLAALTSQPHRLAGTEQGRRAGEYVLGRLNALGIQTFTQDFPVPLCRTTDCSITVDDATFTVADGFHAMQPNVLQGVVTPEEGLTGKLLYAGGGRLSEYAANPQGRIVVLDFAAGDRWTDAFAMGAAAVIFADDGQPCPYPYHHLNVPANFPRFFATTALAEKLKLRQKGNAPTATLKAGAAWEMAEGRNVIGLIRGTDAVFTDPSGKPALGGLRQAMVLSAPLDSLSEVPDISPGARLAANAAGLLALAEQLRADPPRRDVILCFFDGEARNLAGARAFFGELYRGKTPGDAAGTLADRLDMLGRERQYVSNIRDVLARREGVFDAEARKLSDWSSAVDAMRAEAKGRSGQISEVMQRLRMRRRDDQSLLKTLQTDPARVLDDLSPELVKLLPAGQAPTAETVTAAVRTRLDRANEELGDLKTPAELTGAELSAQSALRGQLERSLRNREVPADPAIRREFLALLEDMDGLYDRRLDEIDRLAGYARTGVTLDAVMGPGACQIVLHVPLNLGDQSPRWTFIHGEDSCQLFGSQDTTAMYTKVFQAIREVAKAAAASEGRRADEALGFESRAVSGAAVQDPRIFAPGLFYHAGGVSGMFGISNLAVMTPLDRRVRDGQPCDTVDRLDGQTMLSALRRIGPFLRTLADSPSMSVAGQVTPVALYNQYRFDSNRKYGGASALTIGASGAMDPAPARGAMVAVWRRGARVWDGAKVEATPPGFQPCFVSQVDANGKYELPPFNRNYHAASVVVAAMFEPRGLIDRISNSDTTFVSGSVTQLNTVLFRCHGVSLAGLGFDRGSVQTQALKAASTAALNADRSLVIENGNLLTVYAWEGTDKIKLVNPAGIVALNNEDPALRMVGKGLYVQPFEHWPTAERTAADLYNLNADRLETLKVNRIREISLENLAVEAKELRQKAAALPEADVAGRTGCLGVSAAFSRAAYNPLLAVLNDLVVAVVILLLLTIPFAYAIERLLVGTPHIYRQIAWFAVLFLITFGVLYMVNPAFRIAATPVVIFLAFTIILLSSLVIVIMLRKLQSEVRRMQGLGATVHSSDVSRLGTMMAAVHMGISTMRRRPIRTLLTAVTVVLLTFTILTFASFSSSWGTRRTYVGPSMGEPRLLVRHPLWSRLNESSMDVLAEFLKTQGTLVPRYWVAPTAEDVKTAAAAGRSPRELLVAPADPPSPLGATAGEGASPGTRAEVGGAVALAAMIGLDTRDLADLPEGLLQGDAKALADNGVFLTPANIDDLKLKPGAAINVDGLPCVLAGSIDLRKMTNYRLMEGSSILPVDYQSSGGRADQGQDSGDAKAMEMPETQSAQFITFSADRVGIMPAHLARRLGGRIASVTIYAAPGAELEPLGRTVATATRLPTYAAGADGVWRLFFTSLATASGWRDLLLPVVLGGLIIFATMLGSVSDREKEIFAFSALGLAPPHIASLFFAEAGVYAVVGGMGGYLLGQIVALALSYVSDITMNYSSTNAIATVLIVMCTVLVSTIYPALKASRSANPGIQRAWKIPAPVGDLYDIVFPFTVSAYDITGVVSFLREHFQNYSDTAMGSFAASHTRLFRQDERMLGLEATVALAPFDLGVSERFALLARKSEIEGIEEIRILLRRVSGTRGDWQRANRVFVHELRKQLLIWRSLGTEVMEKYRQQTLGQWQELPVVAMSPETMGVTTETEVVGGETA
jgi:hypothetical protein